MNEALTFLKKILSDTRDCVKERERDGKQERERWKDWEILKETERDKERYEVGTIFRVSYPGLKQRSWILKSTLPLSPSSLFHSLSLLSLTLSLPSSTLTIFTLFHTNATALQITTLKTWGREKLTCSYKEANLCQSFSRLPTSSFLSLLISILHTSRILGDTPPFRRRDVNASISFFSAAVKSAFSSSVFAALTSEAIASAPKQKEEFCEKIRFPKEILWIIKFNNPSNSKKETSRKQICDKKDGCRNKFNIFHL